MALIRSSIGKILEENFLDNHIPLWDMMPNDPSRFTYDNSLKISGGEYIEMLIDTPRTDFVMSVDFEFDITTKGDVCGVLMKSTTGHIIEGQVEVSPYDSESYSFMKLSRNEDSNVYFRVSSDGLSWKDKGSTNFKDGHSLGFYNDSLTSELVLTQVTICSSNFVNINGISRTDSLSLYNSKGEDLLKSGVVDYDLKGNNAFLDLSNLHFPLKDVEIVINENHPRETRLQVDFMYGGDSYEFEPEVYFTIEDFHGNALNGFHLGEINQTEKHFVVVAHNEGYATKHGTIAVESISSYDRGDQMAYLYSYGSDFTGDSKQVGCTIIPGDHFKCILVIRKDSKYVSIDEFYNFKLSFI